MKIESLHILLGILLTSVTIQGEPLTEFVKDYESLNIDLVATIVDEDTQIARVSFKAFNREFKIHLKTHKYLLDPGFKLESISKNGRTVSNMVDRKGFMLGVLQGDKDSTVHGRVMGTSVDIVINTQSESYHLEPASNYALVGNWTSVIYKASDVEYNLEHRLCSSTDSPRLKLAQDTAIPNGDIFGKELLRKRRQVNRDLNTCTLKIVADYEFFREVGNSLESTTLNAMMDHILAADSYYRASTFIGTTGAEYTGFGLSISSVLIYTDNDPANNPLVGDFSTDELLEAFATSEFDDVCLGHLFTYRDFKGVIGLAYLADPDGRLAGGICQTRTRTQLGELNLNTGFTSLLNFGSRLPRSTSFITVAHEIGHNHGSPHDPSDNPDCSPGGSLPKYIMFPSASANGLTEFSICSRRSIGAALESRSGLCFIERPQGGECGDGIVQSGEECDCGSKNETLCMINDKCCTVNCTLAENALCSPTNSSCCDSNSCEPLPAGIICRTGDVGLGGCQNNSLCDGSPQCPPSSPLPDGSSCNNEQNVCQDGSCIGSPCGLFNGAMSCFCTSEEELCHVCCKFDGSSECVSTFNREGVNGSQLIPGSPCANSTGYCNFDNTCLRVNNDDPLDNLRDILLGFTSIAEWLEDNWYWILVGFAVMIILFILIQVTYRRKKIKTDEPDGAQGSGNQNRTTSLRRGGQTYGFYQTVTNPLDEEAETSTLIPNYNPN